VTENGAAYADARNSDGRIQDHARISYLRRHIVKVHEAIRSGIPLRGYFAWSLMDNFEWAHGSSKRFGLIYVEPATLERIPKASADWYRQVIRHNGIDGGGEH